MMNGCWRDSITLEVWNEPGLCCFDLGVCTETEEEKKKTKPNTQGLFMKTHTTTGINTHTHTHTNGNSAMSYLLDNRLEEKAGLN